VRMTQAGGGFPGWLEPELASLTSERFSEPSWIYERKFDGERCLTYRTGGQVRLLTRNQLDVSATYPELHAAMAAQSSADFVVDGEIVAFDGEATSFSRLQQRLGVHSPSPELVKRVPVCYYLFDVLSAGGRDVRSLPLLERKQVLAGVLAFDGPLRFAEHRDGDGEPFWEDACAGRPYQGLAEVQVREQPRIRRRRLHGPARRPRRLRGVARRLLRPAGPAGIGRESRDRVHAGGAAVPEPGTGRDRGPQVTVRGG
jgi:hypothetical protein